MENAKTFILSKLDKISNSISNIRILYKFDSFSNEHLIKIYPLGEFENNQKYQQIEREIIFDFINKYPHDSLVFFSEDDWIDIDNPDIVFEGVNYLVDAEANQFKMYDDFNFLNIEDDIFNLDGILENNTKINIQNKQNDFLENMFFDSFYNNNIIKCGINDFALAA